LGIRTAWLRPFVNSFAVNVISEPPESALAYAQHMPKVDLSQAYAKGAFLIGCPSWMRS